MIMDGLERKFVTVNAEISVSIFYRKYIYGMLKLGRDLSILVNEREISPIPEDFIFTKLHICKVLRK